MVRVVASVNFFSSVHSIKLAVIRKYTFGVNYMYITITPISLSGRLRVAGVTFENLLVRCK